MSKKVMFLFGAGAECDYGMPAGVSFISTLLKDSLKKEREMLLGEKSANHPFIHPNSRCVFLQTIVENDNEAKNIFGDDIFEYIKSYYNKRNETELDKIRESIRAKPEDVLDIITQNFDKKTAEEIVNSFKNKEKHSDNIGGFCKALYEHITKRENENNKGYKFFIENTVFYDALDEKFNTLRFPQKYEISNRVINAYVTIFLLMFTKTYKNDGNSLDSYNKVFQKIIDADRNNDLFNVDFGKRDTYYSLLKNIKPEYCYVTTTNYTPIVEKVADKKVTYLHGRLNWFEDLDKLTVYDCLDTNEEQLAYSANNIMPFILIPSGIKPIICRKQIVEFHNFIKNLDECSILCVVGYRFNSEDNHINSIIADWLREDENKMILFNYSSDNRYMDLEKINWLAEFTKNNNCTDEEILTSKEKIINLEVNGGNSIERYKKLIDTLF